MRIKAQDGAPQTDTTCLQRFGKGQIAKDLPAYDSLDQAIVTAHQLLKADLTTSLRSLEQGDPGLAPGIPRSLSVCKQKTPPELRGLFLPNLARLAEIHHCTWG